VARFPTRNGTLASSVTLAGDTAQRLLHGRGLPRLELRCSSDLGLSGKQANGLVAVEPLRIAYRSTREVLVRLPGTSLARSRIPRRPSRRAAGAPVEHHHVSEPRRGGGVPRRRASARCFRASRARRWLCSRGIPSKPTSYYEALEDGGDPEPAAHSRPTSSPSGSGVEVTEIRQVKGLEYDYVVLVDVNASTYQRATTSHGTCSTSARRARPTSSG
jgi:DNA helicase-2/ATP-dependent DNA helicase PcrA